MRGWSVGCGDCFVDRRTEASCFEGGAELPQQCGDNLCFFCGRPSAERGAEYFQMAVQHRGQIDLGARSLHQADQNEAAALRQRLEIPGQVWTADAVEDHVNAASAGCGLYARREWAAVVIDRDVGAELQALLAFLVGAGGDDRSHVRFLEQQNRRSADAA